MQRNMRHRWHRCLRPARVFFLFLHTYSIRTREKVNRRPGAPRGSVLCEQKAAEDYHFSRAEAGGSMAHIPCPSCPLSKSVKGGGTQDTHRERESETGKIGRFTDTKHLHTHTRTLEDCRSLPHRRGILEPQPARRSGTPPLAGVFSLPSSTSVLDESSQLRTRTLEGRPQGGSRSQGHVCVCSKSCTYFL